RGNQMADRTNAADACHQGGQLVERPSFCEFLEASQLCDMKERFLHLARIAKMNGDFCVPFNSCNRIDDDCFAHNSLPPLRIHTHAPNLVRSLTSGTRPAISSVR